MRSILTSALTVLFSIRPFNPYFLQQDTAKNLLLLQTEQGHGLA